MCRYFLLRKEGGRGSLANTAGWVRGRRVFVASSCRQAVKDRHSNSIADTNSPALLSPHRRHVLSTSGLNTTTPNLPSGTAFLFLFQFGHQFPFVLHFYLSTWIAQLSAILNQRALQDGRRGPRQNMIRRMITSRCYSSPLSTSLAFHWPMALSQQECPVKSNMA